MVSLILQYSLLCGSDYVDLSNLKDCRDSRCRFADLFTHHFQLLNHAGQFTRVIRVSGVSGVLPEPLRPALPVAAVVGSVAWVTRWRGDNPINASDASCRRGIFAFAPTSPYKTIQWWR